MKSRHLKGYHLNIMILAFMGKDSNNDDWILKNISCHNLYKKSY